MSTPTPPDRDPTDEEIAATCSPTSREIAALERENARLRELLEDVLQGSVDHRLTDWESPSLEPSLRADIRAALAPNP